MERLLLVLFGVGLGIKILVVNHNIDPRHLNLDMMVADYILMIFAPLAAVGLNILINRLMPDDEVTDDDEANQTELNEILNIISIADPIDAADKAVEHIPG